MRFTAVITALGLLVAACAGSVVKRSAPDQPSKTTSDPPLTETIYFINLKRVPTSFPRDFEIFTDGEDQGYMDMYYMAFQVSRAFNVLQIPQGPVPDAAEADGLGSDPRSRRGPTLRVQYEGIPEGIDLLNIKSLTPTVGPNLRYSIAADVAMEILTQRRSGVYLVIRPAIRQARLISWAIGRWEPGHGPAQPNIDPRPSGNANANAGLVAQPPPNEPNAVAFDDGKQRPPPADFELGDPETLCDRFQCMALSMLFNMISPE